MKNKRILPSYAVWPIVISVVTQILAFYVTKKIDIGIQPISLHTFMDDLMPFTPAWSSIYILCYISWIINYVLIARESRQHCYDQFAAETMAKLLCGLIFILIPVTITRPPVESDGFFNWLTRLIYRLDTPQNLFPSLHCFASWFSFRGIMKSTKVPTWYKVFSFVFAFFVFASVVYVRQHYFLDIIGGVVLLEIGYLLAKFIPFRKIYEKLERKETH